MKVYLSKDAESDLRRCTNWWAKYRNSQQAARWLSGFLKKIKGLSKNGDRHPLARENDRYPVEIREVYYGLGNKRTHRAVFTIRPNMVYVIRIQHLAQKDIVPEDDGT